jgi:hypothetical protein
MGLWNSNDSRAPPRLEWADEGGEDADTEADLSELPGSILISSIKTWRAYDCLGLFAPYPVASSAVISDRLLSTTQ